MAERTNVSKALNSVDSSTWAVPGAILGVYALTRLPFGMLAGLAVGFAAGWTLRSEYGDAPRPRSRRGADEKSDAILEDEKVDAMSDDSFPASDPPSYTPTRTGKPSKR